MTPKKTIFQTLPPSHRVFGLIPLSLRQGALYALALFLSKGVGFLMIPVFTHFLEPADYGRLDILQTLADLLGIILIMGLGEAFFKFCGEAKTTEQKRNMAANIFGIAIIICLISTALLQLCAPFIHTLLPGDITLWQTRFLFISLSVSACLVIPLCRYRMKDQAGAYFTASAGRVILQATLSAALLYAGFGVTGVMAAGAAAATFWAIKTSRDFWRDYGAKFHMTLWRKIFLYSTPLIFTGMAGFVLGSFDRWILAGAAGPAIMAKYALAAKFGLLAALLVQPFELWWQPRRFEVLNTANGAKKCADHITQGLLIVCLSVITITTGAPLVIQIMTPPEYHDAVQYVPYLSALAGIHASTQLINIGLYNVKITKWPAIIDISAAAIAFFGYVICIPFFGAWGAIIATAMALSVRMFVTFLMSQTLTYLPYPKLTLCGFGVLCISATCALGQSGGNIIIHMILGAFFFALIIIYALIRSVLPDLKTFITERGVRSCS